MDNAALPEVSTLTAVCPQDVPASETPTEPPGDTGTACLPPLDLLDPSTVPCLRSEQLTADGGVVKRTLQEGTGRVIPANAKVWLSLEGRKPSGELFQREVTLQYSIGVKSQKVLSQGLLIAFATMRSGETAWLLLAKAYHLYPPPEAIWLKVRVKHAMEEFIDRLPQAADADARVAFAEKLIAEANLAERAGLYKEASCYYNRAIDGIRGFKAGSQGQWTPQEWQRLKDVHIRCEGNLAQTSLDFSQVPKISDEIRTKRLQEALAHCAVVLDLDPMHAKGLYRKAKASLGLGDLDTAWAAVSECVKVAPDNHQVVALYHEIQGRRRQEDGKDKHTYQKMLHEMMMQKESW